MTKFEKPVQKRGKESRPRCRKTDTITPKKRMSPSKWEWDMVGMRHGRLEHWLFDKSKRRSLKVFKNRGGNLGKAPRLGRGGNLERVAFRYLVMKKNNQELEITSTSKTRGSQNQKIYHHHPPKGGSFFKKLYFTNKRGSSWIKKPHIPPKPSPPHLPTSMLLSTCNSYSGSGK